MKSHLEAGGFRVFPVFYGWFLLRGLLWHAFNVPVARCLAAFTHILHELGYRVVVVAHSNGASIAAKASALGAWIDTLVFINGAVERDCRLGQQTGYLLNCRVATDPVLAVCRVIAPVTPWAELDGSLGSAGVEPDSDPRMWDVNLTETFGIRYSHGGFFAPDRVEETGPWLAKSIDVYLNAWRPWS